MRLLDVIRRSFTSTAESPGLVLAVSGGADSVALFRAVLELELPGPLIIAHVNHQLRGEASDGDEALIRELHDRFRGAHRDLRLEIERIAIPRHENLEAAARAARYANFAEMAREHGVTQVATGHTADDQAETVLLRILRGTGVQGLRGIARERELEPGISLIRPMIDATRADVLQYLEQIGQSFREDASNSDIGFARNRIRHVLLPALRGANPAIGELLTNVARTATESFEAMEVEAAALLKRSECPKAGAMCIVDVRPLTSAPRELQREALRRLWRREDWPLGELRFADWDRMLEVAAGKLAAIDLPGGLHARRRGQVLQVGMLRRS